MNTFNYICFGGFIGMSILFGLAINECKKAQNNVKRLLEASKGLVKTCDDWAKLWEEHKPS